MTFSTISEVAALLPFPLDDTRQVNATFTRWRQDKAEADKRLVDIWTYCFVYRYFLVKFTACEAHKYLAFDRLVATAFADVLRNLRRVRQPECYAGWVGTICRNTFVNHLRAQRSMVSLEQGLTTPLIEAPATSSARDASVLHHSISEAIDALPDFLRDVARMRLLESRSYGVIQEATGKPLPTLRTYVNRALDHLRKNTTLQALLQEIRDD